MNGDLQASNRVVQRGILFPHARIEPVAHRVAQQIDAEQRQRDAQARKNGKVAGLCHGDLTGGGRNQPPILRIMASTMLQMSAHSARDNKRHANAL